MTNRFSRVHISDLEHMGAEVSFDKMVQKSLLFRKYEGQIRFGSDLFYVYVQKSFFRGARLSGIAVPLYRSKEYALLACQRLNDAYAKALLNNTNNIRGKWRKRVWMELALAAVMLVTAVLYIQRAALVAQLGLDSTSVVLSILCPVIMALCYIIHYRIQ